MNKNDFRLSLKVPKINVERRPVSPRHFTETDIDLGTLTSVSLNRPHHWVSRGRNLQKLFCNRGSCRGGGAAGALMRCAETHLERTLQGQTRTLLLFLASTSGFFHAALKVIFVFLSVLSPFLPQNVYERSAALGSLLSWVFVKGRQGFFLFFKKKNLVSDHFFLHIETICFQGDRKKKSTRTLDTFCILSDRTMSLDGIVSSWQTVMQPLEK